MRPGSSSGKRAEQEFFRIMSLLLTIGRVFAWYGVTFMNRGDSCEWCVVMFVNRGDICECMRCGGVCEQE